MNQNQNHHSIAARNGTAMVAILICILVVTMLGATLTKRITAEYRQLSTVQHQAQAFWIAESAVQRALVQIEKDETYQGETWHIDATKLVDDLPGRAVIEVRPGSAAERGSEIRVVAYYPDVPHRRVMVERTVFVKLTTRKSIEKNQGDKS